MGPRLDDRATFRRRRFICKTLTSGISAVRAYSSRSYESDCMSFAILTTATPLTGTKSNTVTTIESESFTESLTWRKSSAQKSRANVVNC